MAEAAVALQRTFQELQIPTPWGHLAAKVWGPDDGVPVLALHGWMDNAGSFDRLAPLLPACARIVCLDFCGHGLSSHYPPGMFINYYDHVLHVKLVIDHFGWNKVSIIGHSMGGFVGIYFCAVFPDLVDKFVSLDAVKQASADADVIGMRLRGVVDDFQRVLQRMQRQPTYKTYREARDHLVENWSGSIGESEADVLLVRGLVRHADDQFYFARDLRITIRPYLFTDFTTEQLKGFARALTCPFLLIVCDERTFPEPQRLRAEFIDIYRQSSSDFRLVRVSGRHHVHLVEPAVVVPHIVDFLFPDLKTPSAKL